jgi:uncharacterized membrane protein
MSLASTSVVLVAALAHALWNIASKYKRGDTVLFVWAYTLASTLLCIPIGIALTIGGVQSVSWQLAVGSTVSAVLHAAYSLTLQTGYDRSDLGVVYPIARGSGPVLTMLFAIVILGERLSWIAIMGTIAIVAGIVFTAGNPLKFAGRRALRGVVWGGATGVMIAGYTLWDSYSITSLHLGPVTYYSGTLLVQTLILTPSALQRHAHLPSTVRMDARPILAVAVLSPLAYILVLIAMQSGPVALIAPLRESSIVIGSLLAWRLFHEGHLARRIAGATAVLAGIVAISL